MSQPVAILGGVRTPFCKIGTQFVDYSGLQLLSEALMGLADKFPIKNERLGEIALGAVFQHPSIWNFSREAMLRAGYRPESPAVTVSRACATSLDASIVVAQKIASGHIEVGVAGGSESMSGLPLYVPETLARKFVRNRGAKSYGDRIKIWKGLRPSEIKIMPPPAEEPSTQMLMGDHCEKMAKEWKVTRQEQDELALASQKNGAAAYDRGFYKDLIKTVGGVSRDNNLRADTSLEKLAKLKPAFDRSETGTLTAGNSSPLTDGAAVVLLSSEKWAKERGIPVLAYLRDFESAAIDMKTEGLLMAPAYAMPRMLARAKRSLQDFDVYEIHEAFAAQVLCTLKAWESEAFFRDRVKMPGPLGKIDRKKLNLAGGSVALGHPFGATGARCLSTVAKLLSEKGSGKGLVSICTGGGMGTVAMLER